MTNLMASKFTGMGVERGDAMVGSMRDIVTSLGRTLRVRSEK